MRVLIVGDPYMPVSAYADAAGHPGRPGPAVHPADRRDHVRPARHRVRARATGIRRRPGRHRRAVAGHDVLIVHGAPVTAEVLDAAPLRLVCCARGGPVNVDVAAATDRGIPVVSTPGKNAEAVAELTIAFALLLIRAVPRASRHLIEGGGFAESVFEGREFFGREAPSLTMGLVGLGHVGREVARRARALGFTVAGVRPAAAARAGRAGVDLVTLDTLLARSDVVSLHARLTPENRQMFSRDPFARMRRGSYFINTARESLVDEAALRRALEEGILGGAALDVLERTPGPASPAGPTECVRHPAHRRGDSGDPGAGRAAGGGRSRRPAGRAGARGRGEPAGPAGGERRDERTVPARHRRGHRRAAGPCCSPRPARRPAPGSGSGPTTSRPACPAARTSTCARAGRPSPPVSGTRCAGGGRVRRRRGGRRGDQHARGDGPVRRRRPRDLRLPQRGQPSLRRGGGPHPRGGRGEDLRRGRRLGVHHRPGPAALAGPGTGRTSWPRPPAWACSATGSCTG